MTLVCIGASHSLAFAAALDSPLTRLAAVKFANLTKCERAVLAYSDLKSTTHGDPPACGPSANFDDPTNDPKNAAQWGHDRELRAELIRWLFVDPDATKQVDPVGVGALGARVVGPLELFGVHAPYALTLIRCAFADLSLDGAEIGGLYLSGSHTGQISAGGSRIRGSVRLCCGFEASGQVFFGNSRIDGDFDCHAGSFRHDKVKGDDPWAEEMPALFLGASKVEGPIWFDAGFTADGAVDVNGVTCIGLFCFGGHFTNPGKPALNASAASLSKVAWLANSGKWSAMEADGLVQFDSARVGGYILASGAKFLGKSSEAHGFSAVGLSAEGGIVWANVDLHDGATLDLRAASVNGLFDDENSWPRPGRLAIDGFVYRDFYSGPSDARSRLRWLSLASGQHPPWLVVPSGFRPQPYRELAKVLRAKGDDRGATLVLVTEEDLRYAQYGALGRGWGGFLKWSIGYGHRPLRVIAWSLAVVLLGWIVVRVGAQSGVMRPTWPENRPTSEPLKPYERLNPLLYSIDVFVPFVNLHQEHYWWPDAEASGECRVLNWNIRVNGALLRSYLWLQIIAGWLLSAVFIAGVTGLLRND
jgi:hypothetical protein